MQSLQGRRAGTHRGRTEHEPALELGLGTAQERHHQPGTAAEPPEDRPFPDAGALRQPVHRERVGAGFLNDFPGGAEQQLPVARRVAALGLCRGPGGVPGGTPAPGLGTGTDGDEAHIADCSACGI